MITDSTVCHQTSWQGKCCCVCRHLIGLRKHPWNTWEPAKGKVTEIFAYACAHPELNEPDQARPTAVLFEGQHGLCEGYEPNE
jgi:hypothetical protein